MRAALAVAVLVYSAVTSALLRDTMAPLVIVKLGGSAITRKATHATLNEAGLAGVVSAVRAAVDGAARVCVVHGAGSFGHMEASEYGIAAGTAHPEWRTGFARTRQQVTRLNHLVVGAFLDAGLPAVGCSPYPATSTAAPQVLAEAGGAALAQAATAALEAGLVPVFHGDAVLDASQGCSILSGDTLTQVLSERLKPTCCVFVADVDGVYDRPPADPGAVLLRDIRVGADGKLSTRVVTRNDHAHDVTGGLEAKIAAAAAVGVATGAPVHVVKAGSEACAEAVAGSLRPSGGTTIAAAGAGG